MATSITNKILHDNGIQSYLDTDSGRFKVDGLTLQYIAEEDFWVIYGEKGSIQTWEEFLDLFKRLKGYDFVPREPITKHWIWDDEEFPIEGNPPTSYEEMKRLMREMENDPDDVYYSSFEDGNEIQNFLTDKPNIIPITESNIGHWASFYGYPIEHFRHLVKSVGPTVAHIDNHMVWLQKIGKIKEARISTNYPDALGRN